MTDYEKKSYLNSLKGIIAYISTYVEAFENGKYTFVDNAEDENIDERKFTINRISKMVLAETISVLKTYSRNILRDYMAGQIR